MYEGIKFSKPQNLGHGQWLVVRLTWQNEQMQVEVLQLITASASRGSGENKPEEQASHSGNVNPI